MTQYFLRLAKRFAVLLPGIVIAYFSVRNIFPYFDSKLPLGFAVLFTYILAAYIILPAMVRVYRIIRPAKHLPLYCVTPDGFASDPLNIGIVATRRELIQSMEKAGWHMADPHNLKNMFRFALSMAYGWSYPNAPMSSLYLFGRKQDIAFEIPIEGQTGHRHHVRFWATTFDESKPLDIRTIDWHHRKQHLLGDNLLWVGAASKDVGVGFIRHNFQVSHMIDPDTNRERQLIVSQLKRKKLAKKIESIKLGKPYKLVNRVLSGTLHTDGNMDIVTIHKTNG